MVISDTDAVYLYGLDIIAEQLAGAERYYYVHDGLGSVRQLVNTAGQIATRYAYDPFGVPLEGNGVPNPWQFTGEAWDAEVELLYLRARYYQPGTGRLITKDPWAGDVWRPSTLNAYAYVDSNPSTYIDPGGLDGWGPGGLFPEITPGAPSPPFVELCLMWISLFPGDPLTLVFLPNQAWWEMLLYSQTGHSPTAAANLSKAIGYSWLFQFGGEESWYGPGLSLTQEVMHSPALARFRQAWRTEGNHVIPWAWKGDHIEDNLNLGRYDDTLYEIAVHNVTMLAAMTGYGSWDAVGPINTLGGVFGSFDLITVEQSEASSDMVRITVRNEMGKASLTRAPGSETYTWPNEDRTQTFWGGTIVQYFYWDEAKPMDCKVRLFY